MLALLFLSASALVFTAGATDCQDGNAAMTAIVMSVETACGGGDVCLDVDACELAIKGISASAFADIKTDLATCTTDEEKNAYVESMLMVVINAYKCGVQSALTTVTGSDAASEAVAGAVAYADLLIDSCVADCRENDDDVRRRRETLTLSNSNEEGPSGSSGSSGSEDVSGTGSHDDSEGCGFPYNDCELAECTTGQEEYGVACKASSKCVDAVDALLADQNALEGIAEFIAMEDDDHSRQRRAGHLAEVTSTLNDLKTLCTPSDSTPSDGETTTVSPTGTVGGGAADMVSSLTLLLATSVIVALL
jgi:hypothetical protein